MQKLLEWYCHHDQLEILKGDLFELYEEYLEKGSKTKADIRFLFNIIDLCRPFAMKKRNTAISNNTAMLKNYFKITLRNFSRQRMYSLLNVSGLSIGITCAILIFLYIQDELSYDRFHSKSDRIYRVLERFESEGVGEHSASLPFPTGPTLKNDFPNQIGHVVRFFNFQSPSVAVANRAAEKNFNESRFFFADSTFLSVFDFQLIAGDRTTALDEPNTVLITKSMAKKYFPGEDPMGKFIEFQGEQNLLVTGILKDTPANTHFQFDFIASFSSLKQWFGGSHPNSWYWNPCWTYLTLNENNDLERLSSLFPDFVIKYFPEFIREDVTLELQALGDIHLYSKLDYEIQANSEISIIYIFGCVAVFVLVIASINFINLSTARASKRAKEVGVRKSLGSAKRQLIYQFVFESICLTYLALIVSVLLSLFLLPAFNTLVEKTISYEVLIDSHFVIGLLAVGAIVGLLSGFYPAFVLSSFKAISALKNNHVKTKGLHFRKVLVTAQFMISIFLITGTLIGLKQLNHLQNKDAGFDEENVVLIPVIRSPIGEHYEQFTNLALQSPNIHSLTAVEEIIGSKHQVENYQFEGMRRSKPFPRFYVRHDFIKTMNIEMIAGRDYSREFENDVTHSLVVNEALVKAMGWTSPEEAITKRYYHNGELAGKIVGVVKDYHFISKHHPIGPLVIDLNTHPRAFNLFIKYMAVKVNGQNLQASLISLEEAWKSVMPNRPFDYFFLDDRLNENYKMEQKLTKVTFIFSGFAIFVACLGLFGLTTFSIERRRKEIGVRKVLGINTLQVIVLLSREFFSLILLAFLVAIPISYFSLLWWLEGFATRIDLQVWPFFTAGMLTFVIAVLTILYQALKASAINPASTLKYE